jgi:hypothetical protein
METQNLSIEQIRQIIQMSFKAGENWGVTYSTWFTPTKQDTREKIEEIAKKIKDGLGIETEFNESSK